MSYAALCVHVASLRALPISDTKEVISGLAMMLLALVVFGLGHASGHVSASDCDANHVTVTPVLFKA